MRVHVNARAGREEPIECVAVNEGESGLYLYSEARPDMSNLVGYVPYENLLYVEPTEEVK